MPDLKPRGQERSIEGARKDLVGMEKTPTEEIKTAINRAQELESTNKELNQRINHLTERNNALTGLNNKLTDDNNRLTGLNNELTGKNNNLTGTVNTITGKVTELTSTIQSANERIAILIDHNNQLTDSNNYVSGLNNSLTGDNNVLTGAVNTMTGKVTELTNTIQSANEKIDTLRQERDWLLTKIEDPTEHTACSRELASLKTESHRTVYRARWSQITSRLASPRRSEFLIVSNMRSGSTWIEAMLGALPDVFTDYEFKWKIGYEQSPVHIVLDEESPTVSEFLKKFDSNRPVVGSKFVFDQGHLSNHQLRILHAKIGGEVKIIHVIRPFRDIFLSRRRGFFHQINVNRASAVSANLREAIEAIGPSDSLRHPAVRVSSAECVDEVTDLLRNDVWVSQLRPPGGQYLRVHYRDVIAQFGHITAFAGSTANARDIAAVTEQPPIVKLPPVDPELLVSNMTELEPVFQEMEALREAALNASDVSG